jgi:hypothetical protein
MALVIVQQSKLVALLHDETGNLVEPTVSVFLPFRLALRILFLPFLLVLRIQERDRLYVGDMSV